MYELVKLAENSYCIECPAKIGVYRINDTEVALIDSGSDKDAGKKVLRILKENGWQLKAIFNTHSHADHIGGNKYLQDNTGCRIFAPGIEAAFTAYPLLEPAHLYGGFPPKDLMHKFLMAQPSNAEVIALEALPEGLEMISLPGHSYDMAGFRTRDDVVYLADSLSSRETLEKYGVGYMVDVKNHLETLEKVKNMQAKVFVPSHAQVSEDVKALAQFNIDAITALGERILELCANPVHFDELLESLFDAYGMTMTAQQHALIGSTLKSCLTWLENDDRAEHFIDNRRMLWRCK